MCDSNFDDIRPFNDEEAVQAFERIASHPRMAEISAYIYPRKDPALILNLIRSCTSVQMFQEQVMIPAIEAIVTKTSAGFTWGGEDNIRNASPAFLAISNHRDIVCDPALFQYLLFRCGVPMTDICIGSNLLDRQLTKDIMGVNRMVKVNRGIESRELYLSSLHLSTFLRREITSGSRSVWVAQKEGRSKNGIDRTAQGVIKMLDMSGEGTVAENLAPLHILPISISYEYEPCDILKARELYISRTRKYVKSPGEDMMSIRTGVGQNKGRIHMEAAPALTLAELEEASALSGNERYKYVMKLVDKRIISHYKLWKTNYIACDLLDGNQAHAEHYTAEEKAEFKQYSEAMVARMGRELNKAELMDIFLHIYANPVRAAENINQKNIEL
ncbi:MAG: acyltransferase [Bacteroidales bacterium]|nr:acyltransferase [Bacteroidales bacterium]